MGHWHSITASQPTTPLSTPPQHCGISISSRRSRECTLPLVGMTRRHHSLWRTLVSWTLSNFRAPRGDFPACKLVSVQWFLCAVLNRSHLSLAMFSNLQISEERMLALEQSNKQHHRATLLLTPTRPKPHPASISRLPPSSYKRQP